MDMIAIHENNKNYIYEIPCFQLCPGLYQVVVASCSFPPAASTNCFVIGEVGAAAVVVDPSPRDESERFKLHRVLEQLALAQGFTYSHLFITHHHVDHYQQVSWLARELSLPVAISSNSYQRILAYQGETYFKDIALIFPREGECMVRWQEQGVFVYEVPGHDEGQLALAPQDMAWFLVGDLIQGAGTVVISTDEGNMSHYYQTLQRIIALNPGLLLPSHGDPQVSVQVLKNTLAHRLEREKQVLELHQKGLSPEQMVAIIYEKVNKRLWPLALENIKSHLVKIREEHLY